MRSHKSPLLSSLTATLVLMLCSPQATAAQDDVAAILESGELSKAYNPVLLNFLLAEGKTALPEEQRKQAIDQLVTALKATIQIDENEQLTADLAELAGQLAGGAVGSAIRGATTEIWDTYIDSADVLAEAGYTEDAVAFYEHCTRAFPREASRTRCALGLARSQPDKAFDLLMGMANESDADVQNVALRILGHMGGQEGFPEEKKVAILTELTKRSEGAMNTIHYLAATQGLIHIEDERAIEPLRGLTKGLTRDDQVKQTAKAGLLLTYEQADMADEVAKSMKGGMLSTNTDADKYWAARTLIRAGDERGYEWALDTLKKKKKGGLFSKKGEKDYFGDMLWFLVDVGGDQTKAVYAKAIDKGKGKDDRKALLAIALARVGDDSELERVRKALAQTKWGPAYRWQAAIALSRFEDHSGIPVLAELATSGKNKKQKIDPEDLRPDIAWALGQVDHADSVAPLVGLLQDENDRTRRAALAGLMRLTDASAASGLGAGLDADFGEIEQRSRNPLLHAQIVRHACARFPVATATADVVARGSQSGYLSVKFLSLLEAQRLAAASSASEGR